MNRAQLLVKLQRLSKDLDGAITKLQGTEIKPSVVGDLAVLAWEFKDVLPAVGHVFQCESRPVVTSHGVVGARR